MSKGNIVGNYLSSVAPGNHEVSGRMLLNTIREMGSDNYKRDIPPHDIAKPINHSTIPVDAYVANQNEFFNILINRIGTTMFKGLIFDNPLGVFRDETFTYGDTAQEIYVGLTQALAFDAKQTQSQFRFFDTPIHTFYHTLKDERKFPRTIEEAWTMKAFISDNAFDSFINKMFATLISSDELTEYTLVRDLITLALSDVAMSGGGTITTPGTLVDRTQANWLMDMQRILIEKTNLFAIPSWTRFENAAGVPNATPKDNQFLLVSAEMSAQVDMMLANAFNMDKASVLAKKIVVDEFATFTGAGARNGMKPIAALISDKTIIFKDKLVKMTNNWNAENLYFNYFLHHHQLLSFSLFENAHIFYVDAATDPILNP